MNADEQARRVRPRTEPAAADPLPGLSPRGTPPGASVPESPRRSMVTLQQLQQWRSDAQPGSPRQAAPAATAALAATAQASTSVPGSPGIGAAPADAFDALTLVPPEGRNTLIAYAADRALSNRGTATQNTARAALLRFGNALLQQQPPIELEAFLDQLIGEDPAQRSAAEGLKLAYEAAQGASHLPADLNTGINALADIPREQRMLTLAQALQRGMVGRSLQTLLPQADQPLLQRVRDAERQPESSDHAQATQTALCRFGVALMVRGHGGLAAWLQLRQQPDGARLADELRESIKNGPELNLLRTGKRQLESAVERLLKDGLGDGGPSSVSRDIPPAGRNMLVVYAADAALIGLTPERRASIRSEFTGFGEALLQQQPPVTLDVFLDRLQSPDPGERSAAEALKAAYERKQVDALRTKGALNTARTQGALDSCFTALSHLPRSQWMLTPGQALQRKVVSRSLMTLLCEADLSILQRVRAAELMPDGHTAGQNLAALVRFGVALMARGHGGLAAWLEMRNEPDGIRRAAELRDSIKDDPALDLDHQGKLRFEVATGRLVAHGTGDDGGTASARPQASGPSTAVSSPAGSSWSVGSAFERLGGAEGLSALLQQMDEMPGPGGFGSVPATPSEVTGPAHEIAGSSQLAPLPPGPVHPAAIDADVGIASGQGLNCLLDTVLQLARGTRRHDFGTPQAEALAHDARELRNALAAVGLVEREGQIDVYGPGGVGVYLAQNLGLRIQVVEANEREGLLAHPVLGQEGPLVHILHTPGHFQPLWPRPGAAIEESTADSSFAVASPAGSAWSLGSALERLGGPEALDALLQQTDEAAAGASAAAASPSDGVAAPAETFEALRHVPPRGRDTLIAYAAEWALSKRPLDVQRKVRSALMRFSDALQMQQPPISLETLLDHLHGEDPVQRSAAEAHKLAYEDAQPDAYEVRGHLNTGLKALADVPREQRMLTLAEALKRGIVGRDMQTLLPEVDQPLLQRVRDSERQPDSPQAKNKLSALCRFGIALMVRGHGGLADWLQMRQQQPDGERLAKELSESIKHGPELNLQHAGKRQLVTAIGRLLKYGQDQAATSPSAAASSPTGSAWSLGAALDRLGGPEGLDALLQQTAETPAPHSPGATRAAALGSPSVELAMAEAAAGASAAAASPSDGVAAPADASEALRHVPPEGHNTLSAYAAERALIDAGSKPGNTRLRAQLAAFRRFGTALVEQHRMTLDTYLDALSSQNAAQRDDAAELKAALVSRQADPEAERALIGHCIRALLNVPRERRMLTPKEALHSKMQAAQLVTLLPQADHELLQKRLASQEEPKLTALRKHALLVRFGVALMAEGHSGLAGWVQMHHQPEGPRLAGELLDRLSRGPELQLGSKRREKAALAQAAEQLRACGLDAAGAGTSSPQAAARVQAGSPRNDAAEDFALLDPGAPTAGDLTFLDALDLTGQGLAGAAGWQDDPLQGLADSPERSPTGS